MFDQRDQKFETLKMNGGRGHFLSFVGFRGGD